MFLNLTKISTLAVLLAVPVALTVAAAPFPQLPEPNGLMTGEDLGLTATYCDQRATVDGTLRHDFAEAPTLAALTGTGMTMELWTSDLIGRWTIVHHGGDGISCVVTSGMDWTAGADAVLLMDEALEETLYQS